MALVLNPALRNIQTNAVAARLAGGTLLLQTAAGVTLGSVQLSAPAFDAAVDGKVTARAIPEIIITTAGAVGRFILQSADGADEVMGTITVTGGGGDVTSTRAAFVVTEGVELSPLTLDLAKAV